ncbi:conserved hypothetical protein [Vibrio chagasii]|nr:conserved hypothetical protein [Vibrio chagasii]CAH7338622.1 conserved hypothetical protein [Vibrio chagasii]
MKMKLSVLMDMKDKTSAVLKGMSSESDRYAKSIKKVQKSQADDSAAMGMINAFKSARKTMEKNALAAAAVSEKLETLKVKAAIAKTPSAALTETIAKQQTKLNKLNAEQQSYQSHLKKLDAQLKKTGVNTNKLDGEYDRLNQSYKKHGKEIAKLSRRYTTLQGAMGPIQKLNRAIKFPKIGSVAAGKGAALLGGVSLAGLISQVNETAGEMDNLAKVSANLDLPIQELQAMQSQAEHAGVSSDALSKSMMRFTKRLGVLQKTGSGAFGSYLKQSRNALHRDLQSAKGTKQAYEMILEEFSQLKTPQEQMAFADAAFGDDGRKMLIMLREGTEGLAAARKELNDLGGGATAEDAAKAEAYNDALQKIEEIVRSMKFAALAPIMEKATKAFTTFSEKFENKAWRTDFIEKLIQTLDGLYQGFELLGKGLIWVTQNFKGILATVAIFKVALIALNAAVMANPFGLMVAAVSAAVIAITYLIDKFIGLDKVIKWIGEGIGWLWDKFKSLINKLPEALIPDGWKIQTDEAGREIDNLANKLSRIEDKNATLGITTNETRNRTVRSQTEQRYHTYQTGSLQPTKQNTPYSPLGSQMVKSKSEVSLTIKSDKPVAVEKVKSEKGTDLNLDVGNMATSF